MDKVLATRLVLSVAIIIGYLVIAGLGLQVGTIAPILIILLVLVLFVPVRKKTPGDAGVEDSAKQEPAEH